MGCGRVIGPGAPPENGSGDERHARAADGAALLNHRVGARVHLRDLDFDCLDVISRHGPISPTALAGRVGVHLATMTGVLNRLEKGGWISRDRASDDRRAVVLASPPDRQREIFAQFGGMNSRMGQILAGYTDDQLDTTLTSCARRPTLDGFPPTRSRDSRGKGVTACSPTKPTG